ncbi:MAG: hypothetical protein PHV74_03240 [Dehalococcoidia bacterium]|nr:hypothetical protein [Dehalococcoidia bacterium]
MDKAIITVLLIIAGVVCVTVMFNGIFPAITKGSDAVVSMASQVDDRIKSQVSIVHAVSEYDPDSPGEWNDVNGNGSFDVFAWVKNVGDSRILAVNGCDVFFGAEGNFQRISHDDYVSSGFPYWQDTIEDTATEWGRGETLKITIVFADSFASSGMAAGTTYLMKVIIPNGISDEIYFSL